MFVLSFCKDRNPRPDGRTVFLLLYVSTRSVTWTLLR